MNCQEVRIVNFNFEKNYKTAGHPANETRLVETNELNCLIRTIIFNTSETEAF